jgi:CheY-like chemotaxis protein
MLRRLINENIEMEFTPGAGLAPIMADANYLGQVLMNLVVNARDAMPKGGKIAISTSNVTLDEEYARTHRGVKPGEYVMLTVSDTGAGMTEEVKARLFEAFFTTKPKGKGTGLGLATCRNIVQRCAGHIEIESELGKGATFKVCFPRANEPVAVEPEAPVEMLLDHPLTRGHEMVLVVEDDTAVRNLACRVLEERGYGVLSATNGKEALHLVRGHRGSPIRLVITDVIMPLMGGEMLAEWLKTANPDLKVLFTSGYTGDTITHHGMLNPGVEFLAKPYTPAILLSRVRTLLDEETAWPSADDEALHQMAGF